MTHRYKRQIVLPEIGPEGQARLRYASVLCVGAGGLGSPALLYLAAAGVGHIGIVDFDHVDETNLQRQILFSTEDVGLSKVDRAAMRLRALNPDIRIDTYPYAIEPENVEELFCNYDIILDGTDNFAAKFLINDAAVKTDKPWIYGAIQGFDGQVSVFDTRIPDSPCYRCLHPHIPKARIQTCAENGVIGAVAGIIGVTQALQAIQLLIQHSDFTPLVGTIFALDARTMHTQYLQLKKNPDCPVCSKSRGQIKFEKSSQPVFCMVPVDISIEKARDLPHAVFIDVREQNEWDSGHLESHIHFPLSFLLDGKYPNIQRDTPVILLCAHGNRSQIAAQILNRAGFSTVYNLIGGYSSFV